MMRSEELTTKTEKNSQKILKKLISEEIIAADFYMGAINSVKPEELHFIVEKFLEIQKDERDDHQAALTKYAMEHGYEVPFKYKDIEKYASKKMVSKFNALKKDETAAYYVKQAIECEKEAIMSFEEAMSQEYDFELQPILLSCYYDELQHLEDLQLLLTCTELGVEVR